MRTLVVLLMLIAAAPAFGQQTIEDLQVAIAQRLDALEQPQTVALAAAPTVRRPKLRIVVWDTQACPAGAKAEAEIVEHLARSKWRLGKHYEVIRSDAIGQCPEFYWDGQQFSKNGYTSWMEWRRELNALMGIEEPPPLLTEAVQQAQPQPQYIQQAPRSVPPARRQWNYYGSGSLADHLRQTHGIDPSNMSSQDMRNAHSHAHEGTWPQVRQSTRPVRRAACPFGGC